MVPGPTRVSSSPSLLVVMPSSRCAPLTGAFIERRSLPLVGTGRIRRSVAGLGGDQVLHRGLELGGGGGKRQSPLLDDGREDADHGRRAVDVGQDRRTGIAEIGQALQDQQPVVPVGIRAEVALPGWGITPFLAIADLGDRAGM